MGKTDHGDNCQGENGGVKTAWGKCLWGFTDQIVEGIEGIKLRSVNQKLSH